MTQKPPDLYLELAEKVAQLEREACNIELDCAEDPDAETPNAEAACAQLDHDKQQLQEDLADTRLVLIGRNGVGKTSTLEEMMILSEVCCNRRLALALFWAFLLSTPSRNSVKPMLEILACHSVLKGCISGITSLA